MAGDSGKKLFVGPRFRRIRQQLGLSQTQIAEGLGISPSYVNLIERNQRPVTAQILLRLAETYDLDLRDLATADEDRFFAELQRWGESQKGWHLCIIERSVEKPIHWAALLRWSDATSGRAEGYLIADINPLTVDPQLKTKDLVT